MRIVHIATPFRSFAMLSVRTLFAGALAGVLSLSGPAASAHEFPDDWFWTAGNAEAKASHEALEGKPMPPLRVSEWRNGRLNGKAIKGKILVVDFWATWCGPCLAAMPHNNEVFNTYKDQGVIVVGICGSKRGQEKFDAVLKEKQVIYPNARDTTGKAAEAWNVQWWPNYAVVDRNGIVRASGLNPRHVEDVLKKLLAEQPHEAPAEEAAEAASVTRASIAGPAPRSSTAAATIPAEWLEGDAAKRARLDGLDPAAPPAWDLSEWINHAPVSRDDLAGKVVVLDFWATWCGPCISSIPKNNALAERYADEGLVVIGVCHPKGADKMADTVEEHGIAFPVAADADGTTIAGYHVDGFPDYYVFDRAGHLRGADVKNKHVEDVVKILLEEPVPESMR